MAPDLEARAAALPVPFSVLSSLKFYGRDRGGGLPGTWFVAVLGELGVAENTVRQALRRLERKDVLTARKKGRTKFYSATRPAAAAVEVGAEKLFRGTAEEPWDGMWTLVHLHLGPGHRPERDRLVDILLVEGFAPLGGDAFIHPRERTLRVVEAARDLGVVDDVATFRGRRTDASNPRRTAVCWDLAVVRSRYERFLADFAPAGARPAGSIAPRSAFAGRLVLVHDFLEAAWADPDLPAELLPPEWPADRARRVAQRLYRHWKPAGLAFCDEILARVRPSAVRPGPV